MADINVTVCHVDQFDDEWPGDTLAEVIEWFTAEMAAIPEEFRAEARCKIDGESGYDSSVYASILIRYSRPETSGEAAARIAKEQALAQVAHNKELALLKTLKAKYEGAE